MDMSAMATPPPVIPPSDKTSPQPPDLAANVVPGPLAQAVSVDAGRLSPRPPSLALFGPTDTTLHQHLSQENSTSDGVLSPLSDSTSDGTLTLLPDTPCPSTDQIEPGSETPNEDDVLPYEVGFAFSGMPPAGLDLPPAGLLGEDITAETFRDEMRQQRELASQRGDRGGKAIGASEGYEAGDDEPVLGQQLKNNYGFNSRDPEFGPDDSTTHDSLTREPTGNVENARSDDESSTASGYDADSESDGV